MAWADRVVEQVEAEEAGEVGEVIIDLCLGRRASSKGVHGVATIGNS
jgi:hypothetical protein